MTNNGKLPLTFKEVHNDTGKDGSDRLIQGLCFDEKA
jgi:hypothetical protein